MLVEEAKANPHPAYEKFEGGREIIVSLRGLASNLTLSYAEKHVSDNKDDALFSEPSDHTDTNLQVSQTNDNKSTEILSMIATLI